MLAELLGLDLIQLVKHCLLLRLHFLEHLLLSISALLLPLGKGCRHVLGSGADAAVGTLFLVEGGGLASVELAVSISRIASRRLPMLVPTAMLRRPQRLHVWTDA